MNTQAFDLERFVLAQDLDYDQALAELVAGHKRTHWIWYVLPQLRDLGRSQMARKYGISNRAEAEAYMAHPVLGPRLLECVSAMLGHSSLSAEQVLGEVDAIKFRSCLTLFAEVAPSQKVLGSALTIFFQGRPDEATLRLLGSDTRAPKTGRP